MIVFIPQLALAISVLTQLIRVVRCYPRTLDFSKPTLLILPTENAFKMLVRTCLKILINKYKPS